MFFLSSCNTDNQDNTCPVIEDGILDLTDWDFTLDGILKVDGNAEFYFKELIYPEEFANGNIPERTGYVNISNY